MTCDVFKVLTGKSCRWECPYRRLRKKKRNEGWKKSYLSSTRCSQIEKFLTWKTNWTNIADIDELLVTKTGGPVIHFHRRWQNKLRPHTWIRQEDPLRIKHTSFKYYKLLFDDETSLFEFRSHKRHYSADDIRTCFYSGSIFIIIITNKYCSKPASCGIFK